MRSYCDEDTGRCEEECVEDGTPCNQTTPCATHYCFNCNCTEAEDFVCEEETPDVSIALIIVLVVLGVLGGLLCIVLLAGGVATEEEEEREAEERPVRTKVHDEFIGLKWGRPRDGAYERAPLVTDPY
jgi:hypothetical protein